MATKNPKISVYVTPELKQDLIEYSEEHKTGGLSGTIVAILNEYLGHTRVTSNAQVTYLSNTVSELVRRVELLEKKLEQRQTKSYSRVPVEYPSKQSNVPITQSNADGWMTTGEAYAEAQRRGYQKAPTTFRRALRDGATPKELERLGLVTNFEVRNQANPKDNSVRWLRFKQ